MSKLLHQKYRINFELFLVLLLLTCGILFTLYQNITQPHQQHFSLQAESILQGRWDIQENGEMTLDTVVGKDGRKYFWHSPVPSFLMIPFVVVFGHRASQGYLNLILTAISGFLVWKLIGRLGKDSGKISIVNRLWFLMAFFFGTSVISIIWPPSSWYLTQNLALTLMLWGIYEWGGKRRIGVLFLIFLILTMVRQSSGALLGVYVLIDWIMEMKMKRTFLIRGAGFLVLAFIGVVAGYLLSKAYLAYFIPPENLNIYRSREIHLEDVQVAKMQEFGYWGVKNIPTNFVKYFIGGVNYLTRDDRDYFAPLVYPYFFLRPDGVSFFFFSPIFLALFFVVWRWTKTIAASLAGVAGWFLIFLPLYSTGPMQWGVRYTADMVPFLFLIFASLLAVNFNKRIKALIVLSVVLNMLVYFWVVNGRWMRL